MIYHKNGAPFPESGRYSQVFEYMFVLLKGKKPNTVNIIKDKVNRWAGSSPYGKRSIRTIDGDLKQTDSTFVVGQYGSRYNVWYINCGAGFTSKDKITHQHPACVDIHTECLTINGWKKYNEIKIGDELLSYNIKTDTLEWDILRNIHIDNEYNGEVLNLNSRRLSMFVTERHRNIVVSGDSIIEKETRFLKKSDNILTSCPRTSNTKELPKEFCYLLGIILTDGYINKSYIGISQDYVKNKSIVDKITQGLDKLNIRYTFGKRERYYRYDGKKILDNMKRIDVKNIGKFSDIKTSYDMDIRIWDFDQFLEYIPNKNISNKLFKLNSESIKWILDGIIDGDGFYRNGLSKRNSNIDAAKSFIISGKHADFHKNLQILCTLGGYTSDYIGNNYTQITKSRHKVLRNSTKSLIEFEDYSGTVWCPQVKKNGTFVARRNGKVFITGNSFPESLAEDHILSWSKEGDVVFDPMVGSGTTPKMAKMNNRNYIGFDINEEYSKIAKIRLDGVKPYTEENPNPKIKFLANREDTLARRKNKVK